MTLQPLKLIAALAIVALPLLEIALLIKAGQVWGFWPVLGIVVGTGVAGVWTMRHQGLSVLTRMSEAAADGREPHALLVDSGLRLLAGLLLLLPGLMTDALGLLLLLPPVRALIASRVLVTSVVMWRHNRRAGAQAEHPESRERDVPPRRPATDALVIEGEFERLDERTVDPARSYRPKPRDAGGRDAG